MISSILNIGDKLDIRFLQQVKSYERGGERPRILKSMIHDIKKDGILEIGMPTEGTRIVLLPLGVRFSLLFYTRQGMYQCIGQVRERYKSDNLYMATVELKTSLNKFQRREFFRQECLLDVEYLPVTEKEMNLLRPEAVYGYHMENNPEDDMRKGIAVDLSGGGLRLVTDDPISEMNLLLNFSLENGPGKRDIWLLGNLIQSKQLENGMKFEHRIMFIVQDDKIREEIIRYIFEEERKSRKKGKG